MNCHEFETNLDEYFHKEIRGNSLNEMNRHYEVCKPCRDLYTNYGDMCSTLRDMKVVSCPEDVVEQVYAKIKSDSSEQEKPFWKNFYVFVYHNRLSAGLVTAVLLVVALSVIMVYWPEQPQVAQEYSPEEIELAYDQVKYTFSQINTVANRTQDILEKDIIIDRVVKPVRSSMHQTLTPIFYGEKL